MPYFNTAMLKSLLEQVPLRAFLDDHGGAIDVNDPIFGHNGKSVGWRLNDGTWLRVAQRLDREQERLWSGSVAAAANEVPGPRLLDRIAWRTGDTEWALQLFELAKGLPLSRTLMPPPGLELRLSTDWWHEVGRRLKGVATWPTDRVAVTQELISRRLREALPRIDPHRFTVTRWTTGHADLHWQNITDQCELLDWESWGRVPDGLDVATLWAFSLTNPSLAEDVLMNLESNVRDPKNLVIGKTFMVVELINMSERSNEYLPFAAAAAQQLDDLEFELERD